MSNLGGFANRQGELLGFRNPFRLPCSGYDVRCVLIDNQDEAGTKTGQSTHGRNRGRIPVRSTHNDNIRPQNSLILLQLCHNMANRRSQPEELGPVRVLERAYQAITHRDRVVDIAGP